MSATYEIGTEIYYTGDMANAPGAGFVRSIRVDSMMGESMDIEILSFTESDSEEREFLGLTMAHFAPGPGRRFWTMEEWKVSEISRRIRRITPNRLGSICGPSLQSPHAGER